MFKMISNVLILTAVTLFLQTGGGFALNIEITPNKVNGLVHNQVFITCLDNSDAAMKEVVMIDVVKEAKAVAILRHDSKISIPNGKESLFQAQGEISVDGSFLQVMMSNPSVEDSGEYGCLVYYLGANGFIYEERANANLTVSDQDIKSSLRHIADELSALKSELALAKNESKKMEIELQSQLIEFKRKENLTVTFTAYRNDASELKVGEVVVFNNVITNEGQGYNGTSGIFTAPVAGYYFLHLSVTLESDDYAYLDLVSSKGQKLPRISVGSKSWNDGSSGSCLAKLESGEKIRPVAMYGKSSPNTFNQDTDAELNSFSGYLLKRLY